MSTSLLHQQDIASYGISMLHQQHSCTSRKKIMPPAATGYIQNNNTQNYFACWLLLSPRLSLSLTCIHSRPSVPFSHPPLVCGILSLTSRVCFSHPVSSKTLSAAYHHIMVSPFYSISQPFGTTSETETPFYLQLLSLPVMHLRIVVLLLCLCPFPFVVLPFHEPRHLYNMEYLFCR